MKRIFKSSCIKLKRHEHFKEAKKMKWKTLMVTATLSTMLLAACGTDNANDTAMRNQDNTLRNVNYNPNNNNGYPNSNNNYGYPNGNDNVMNGADRNNNRDHITNRNNNDGINVNNRNNNRMNVNNRNDNQNRMAVADKAADKIVSMREVDQANVIVTDNNAYVAAKLANHNGNRLEKDIENKISDVVKSTDQNIDNVYVSVNPDFYERTTSYANDIRNGRPIAGFFDEFNTLVRRVFPTER
jgi:spore cortex protein